MLRKMNVRFAASLIIAFFVSHNSFAAPTKTSEKSGGDLKIACANLANEVEEGVKLLSFISARSSRGDIVPKDLEKTKALALIQANLTLMSGNKCPMPTLPITENAYMKHAEKCAETLRKQNIFTGTFDSVECSQKNWVRDKK